MSIRGPRMLIAVAAVVALAASAALSYTMSETPAFMSRAEDASMAERAFIAGLLAEASSEDAYRQFKAEYAERPEGVRHGGAHVFGELLYRKEGLSGVVVCDGSFGFGCYHSFFGLAIAEQGAEVSRELDELCFAAYGRLGTGCPHGIGHGLMWYFGDERLSEALSFCEGMRYQGMIGGCSDGVFMEYNDHTMATADGAVGRRPYAEALRHAPCDEVEERYKAACYYRQADWWHRSLGEDVKRVGGLCAEVKDGTSRDSCYRGLGYAVAIDAAYAPEASARRCGLLADGQQRERCLEGAAWALISDPQYEKHAPEVCAYAADQSYCMKAAVIIQ